MALQQHVIEQLPRVEGILNYLKPATGKPRTYGFEPPPAGETAGPPVDPQAVPIHDLRPLAAQVSLDREGFALLTHRSAVTDFVDEDALHRVYYPEAERLVAEATGAARVVIFDHTVRRRVPGVVDRTPGTPRQPSTRI